MPLTSKGKKIMKSMKDDYGKKGGERVFYASKNAKKISGVDNVKKKSGTKKMMGGGKVARKPVTMLMKKGGKACKPGYKGKKK